MRRSISLLSNQHGMALPLAMLALVTLSALVVGFSLMSSSEPTIANSQVRVAQARAMAEAGVERAMWALSHPDHALGFPENNDLATKLAPYDNSVFFPMAANGIQIGGFVVTVVGKLTEKPWPAGCPAELTARERCIGSVGFVPNNTTTPRIPQKIAVVVSNPGFAFRDVPAALSVSGELDMYGKSTVDSRRAQADLTCGKKAGTMSLGDTTGLDKGSAQVWGAADNNDLENEDTDAVQNVAPSVFDPNNSFLLTDSEIDALRAYAKAHGTYYQGNKTFTSGNLPNGVVFIDTTDGTNITQEGVTPATDSSKFASVDIHGNAPAGLNGDGIFHGWLFVNGTATISGNFQMKGVVYSQNDLVYHGTGTGEVSGAMVSRNIRDADASRTSIEAEAGGNAKIFFDCRDARTGGGVGVPSWALKSGTYKELAGS